MRNEILSTTEFSKDSKRRTGAGDRLFPNVAIGASSGGLEAFTQLIRARPDHTGMAFVFVQHLDPTHHSLLSKALEAKNGADLQPNRVYVIPPNVKMGILQGRLQLTPGRRRWPSLADRFLYAHSPKSERARLWVPFSPEAVPTALWDWQQSRAKSAKYDGMPRSAIASGCVHFVLTAEEIMHDFCSGSMQADQT